MKLDVRNLKAGTKYEGWDAPLAQCPKCKLTALDLGMRTTDTGDRRQVFVHEMSLSHGGNMGGAHYTTSCVIEGFDHGGVPQRRA